MHAHTCASARHDLGEGFWGTTCSSQLPPSVKWVRGVQTQVLKPGSKRLYLFLLVLNIFALTCIIGIFSITFLNLDRGSVNFLSKGPENK